MSYRKCILCTPAGLFFRPFDSIGIGKMIHSRVSKAHWTKVFNEKSMQGIHNVAHICIYQYFDTFTNDHVHCWNFGYFVWFYWHMIPIKFPINYDWMVVWNADALKCSDSRAAEATRCIQCFTLHWVYRTRIHIQIKSTDLLLRLNNFFARIILSPFFPPLTTVQRQQALICLAIARCEKSSWSPLALIY